VFFIHVFQTVVSHEEYFLKQRSKQTSVGELFVFRKRTFM